VLVSSYTFDKAAQTVTFSSYGSIVLENILLIVDATNNTTIYQTNVNGMGGSVSGNVLTLAFNTNTGAFSNSDKLQIFYEDATATIGVIPLPSGASTASGVAAVVTALGSPFQAGGSIANTTFASSQSGTWDINNVSGTVSLPTGASTSALQTTSNGSLSSIDSKVPSNLTVSSTRLLVDGSGVTQPISAAALPLPAGAATATGLTTINTTLGSPFQAGGSIGNTSFASTQSGTWNITNISGTVSLPTGAATSANQATEISSLSTIATNTGNIPAKGLASVANSTPVAFPNATSLTTSAFNSTTGVINTDLLTGTTSGWFDAAGYTSFTASIYTTTTVTAGVITFEQTNDTTNDASGIAMNLQDVSVLTQTNVTTLTLAASTIKRYIAPITSRYIRFRLSTAFTGTGTVGATLVLKQTPHNPITVSVNQATGASLNTAVSALPTLANVTTVATVSTVTNGNVGLPGIIADVASAALTTTTTTATLTPTFGQSYQVSIPVTVVSGTAPTLDVQIQESRDTGTNWTAVYDFPRITATGFHISPLIPLSGNRVRYVQTVSGTTPSFTRAINRLQSSSSVAQPIRQMFDRTINLTSLNSTTASLSSEQSGESITMTINVGAITTTAPALQVQASDDFGFSWYSIGSPLTAVASSTVSATITGGQSAQLYRAIVTTAGVGVTAGYVMLRSF
jgi:hypothetical protein